MTSWQAGIALSLLIVSVSAPAHATLGGKASTIENDRIRMVGRKTAQTVQGDITRHEITLESGTVTRQLTRADGTVFAVSWQGPMRPNLNQLFGAGYYKRFQNDNAPVGRTRMRRALTSTHSDFVVRTGGHSGAFWGFAFLPQAAPAGFSAQSLQAGAQ